MGFLYYERRLKTYARMLRGEMTKQERHLWYDFLRNYPIKFLRQKPIGTYIADFYCHASRLIVEVDGSQHYEPKGILYDDKRDKYLRSQGFEILRFSNLEIEQSFGAVCSRIEEAAQQKQRRK